MVNPVGRESRESKSEARRDDSVFRSYGASKWAAWRDRVRQVSHGHDVRRRGGGIQLPRKSRSSPINIQSSKGWPDRAGLCRFISRENLPDHVAVDVSESALDAVVVVAEAFVIEIPFISTSEDVQEYRLNAESGKMVLKLNDHQWLD